MTAGRSSRCRDTRNCPRNVAARPSESCTWCLGSIATGRCFCSSFQNVSSAFHAGFGSGHAPSPGGNSTSSLSQTVANAESRSFGRDVGLEQRHHVRVAGRARAGDEVAPGSLAQLEVLHLVELGEAGRHAGFDRPLAQQARAERVDGAGEEALEIRERRLQPRDASARPAPWPCARTRSLASSARWKRPRSSDAALRVNVTAAMCSTW